ncbi:MAG: hypothetical protein AB2806_21465 [Candidatus Thiodiazotropha sp.]
MNRYILYQPMHGIAVEIHILEIMRHLARILDRIIVLPKLPVLESMNYEEDLSYYFEIPKKELWISTSEFLDLGFQEIDELYHVIPRYRAEYNNQLVKELHPVWLKLIEQFLYFQELDFSIKKISPITLYNPLCENDVKSNFNNSAQVIAISYVNGIIDDALISNDNDVDEFIHHQMTPNQPHKRFLKIAQSFMLNKEYTAVHWRRGANAETMANKFWNKPLAEISEYYKYIPEHCERIYLATDTRGVEFAPPSRSLLISKYYCDSPNRNAVVDMCGCILADKFIGSQFSTFSNYIYHSRTMIGKSVNTSILL